MIWATHRFGAVRDRRFQKDLWNVHILVSYWSRMHIEMQGFHQFTMRIHYSKSYPWWMLKRKSLEVDWKPSQRTQSLMSAFMPTHARQDLKYKIERENRIMWQSQGPKLVGDFWLRWRFPNKTGGTKKWSPERIAVANACRGMSAVPKWSWIGIFQVRNNDSITVDFGQRRKESKLEAQI